MGRVFDADTTNTITVPVGEFLYEKLTKELVQLPERPARPLDLGLFPIKGQWIAIATHSAPGTDGRTYTATLARVGERD
jgi:hypothetical protein